MESWGTSYNANTETTTIYNFVLFVHLCTEDEEDATHIVYPTVDPLEEEYARPVFRRGNHVLVHWYYLPDSHDTWAQADLPVLNTNLN